MTQNETDLGNQPEIPGQERVESNFPRLTTNIYRLLGRLTVNEWLTLLIALGSLAVSYMTFRASQDTTELRNAIKNISLLADQTKRQADATGAQLAEIRRQADSSVIIAQAAKDSAQAAQSQTRAISEQTTAIKASSDANIKASDAQRKMADVTALANMPQPDLMELSISGLTSEADKNGIVTVPLHFRFRNVGGSAFVVKTVEFGLWVGTELPDTVPKQKFIMSGAGVTVAPSITSAFAPAKRVPMSLTKAMADAVNKKVSKIFFYSVLNYVDQSGVERSRCFAREFRMKDDGASEFYYPAGGPAYRCQT